MACRYFEQSQVLSFLRNVGPASMLAQGRSVPMLAALRCGVFLSASPLIHASESPHLSQLGRIID